MCVLPGAALPCVKCWKVYGQRGLTTRWYVDGFDYMTGNGATVGPFKRLWRAKLAAWWRNFNMEAP